MKILALHKNKREQNHDPRSKDHFNGSNIKYEQKQPQKVFYKKKFLKFAKFTGNTCVGLSFLIKLQGAGLPLFEKKDSDTDVSPRILQNF